MAQYVRFTVRGKGLLNNQVLDRMRLSDDEEHELVELMDYGLQQPSGVPSNAIFAFTKKGVRKHARLLEILEKAAIDDVETEYLDDSDYEVVWESNDGQVALVEIEDPDEDEEDDEEDYDDFDPWADHLDDDDDWEEEDDFDVEDE